MSEEKAVIVQTHPIVLGTRSTRRLKGFILQRMRNKKLVWVKLDFSGFEELSGYTDRTARRSKKWLEENDEDFVFRTVSKQDGRGWEVLVALKERLKYDHEPLFLKNNGNSRNVRDNLRGEQIEHSQLTLLKGQFKDPPPPVTDENDDNVMPEDPNQAKLEFNPARPSIEFQIVAFNQGKPASFYPDLDPFMGSRLTDICSNRWDSNESAEIIIPRKTDHWFNEPTFTRLNEDEIYEKIDKTLVSEILNSPIWKNRNTARKNLIGLAHILKRKFKHLHWDNCKVSFSPGHAYNFALKALTDGWDIRAISDAYNIAVHQRHKDATDTDEHYNASSTITLAYQILQERIKNAA